MNTKLQKCDVEKLCGGCQYLGIPYEEELQIKNRKMQELLGCFGRVDSVIPSKTVCHYRNKVTGSLKFVRGGKVATRGMKKGRAAGTVVAGIYEQGTHSILSVDHCYIEDEQASKIIHDAAKLLGDFGILVYNEDTGRGLVRHLQVRKASATGDYMLTIVTSDPIFPSAKNFCKKLITIHPEIKTIVQNINDKRTSMILGNREKVLYGKGFIEDRLFGLRFRISSASFYQVNASQTEKLYQTAFDMLKLSGDETVLDAYSGTGTIGLSIASKVGTVIGVELNRDAVEDAKQNAKQNRIENAHFFQGDAGVFIEESGREYDIVILDPPRSGSDQKFLNHLLKNPPKKVVYISCGPEALKRDLDVLKKGFSIDRMQPVDMFPRTEHVETVVLMSKVNTVKG